MAEEARSRLGRGLAALIGDVGGDPVVLDRGRAQRRLPIAHLRPNPRNPRKSYDAGDLDDLASSIRERGIVQPILVRQLRGAADSYEIIAGERRWRAAQKVGLHEVPVVIHDVDDKQALEIAIIENVQRSDLNALEEAFGYQQLIDEYKYSQSHLAEVIGKSRSHIANTLRLLKLPEPVQEYLRSGQLTAGHARAIVTLADPEGAARRIVEAGLSVRDAEAIGATDDPSRKHVAKAETKDADTRALEKTLSDAMGLVVSIKHRKGAGEVRIRYRTLEQLDEICRRVRRGDRSSP